MLEENQQFLKFKMKLSTLIKKKLNNDYYKVMIDHLFEEVADDIKILEDKIYANHPNQFINYVCEECGLNPVAKDSIRKKYEETYCPSSFFEYFNKSEKVNYLIMRNKIDKILNISKIVYEI